MRWRGREPSPDLVLLDADPLSDIRNARRIYQVIMDGVIYDPDQIMEGLRWSITSGRV